MSHNQIEAVGRVDALNDGGARLSQIGDSFDSGLGVEDVRDSEVVIVIGEDQDPHLAEADGFPRLRGLCGFKPLLK